MMTAVEINKLVNRKVTLRYDHKARGETYTGNIRGYVLGRKSEIVEDSTGTTYKEVGPVLTFIEAVFRYPRPAGKKVTVGGFIHQFTIEEFEAALEDGSLRVVKVTA